MTLAYRRVLGEDSPRPVALIVVCDLCGNREVAFAWHDHGRVLLWNLHPFVKHRKPPDEKLVERASPTGVWRKPGCVQPRCPRHGFLAAREVIDPAELSPATTRRIRADRSTA